MCIFRLQGHTCNIELPNKYVSYVCLGSLNLNLYLLETKSIFIISGDKGSINAISDLVKQKRPECVSSTLACFRAVPGQVPSV